MKSEPVERIPLIVPEVEQINLEPINWMIITPENADSIWRSMESKNFDTVLFGLTDRDYENFSVNTAKIRKLVSQQNSIINSYRRYYETTENP